VAAKKVAGRRREDIDRFRRGLKHDRGTIVHLKGPRDQWRPGMTIPKSSRARWNRAGFQLPGVANIWTQPIINRIGHADDGNPVGDWRSKVFGADLTVLEGKARENSRYGAHRKKARAMFIKSRSPAAYISTSVPTARAAARYGIGRGCDSGCDRDCDRRKQHHHKQSKGVGRFSRCGRCVTRPQYRPRSAGSCQPYW